MMCCYPIQLHDVSESCFLVNVLSSLVESSDCRMNKIIIMQCINDPSGEIVTLSSGTSYVRVSRSCGAGGDSVVLQGLAGTVIVEIDGLSP